MSKSADEIAADIVVAWLHAIGSAGASSPQPAFKTLETLVDQDKITEFYSKVYKVVRNAFSNSKES